MLPRNKTDPSSFSCCHTALKHLPRDGGRAYHCDEQHFAVVDEGVGAPDDHEQASSESKRFGEGGCNVVPEHLQIRGHSPALKVVWLLRRIDGTDAS